MAMCGVHRFDQEAKCVRNDRGRVVRSCDQYISGLESSLSEMST